MVLLLDEGSIKRNMAAKDKSQQQPSEFGGPVGAFLMVTGLPVIVYAVNLSCNKQSCSITDFPNIPTDWRSYLDLEAAGIFLAWFFVQVILSLIPIGQLCDGQPLRHGGRLKYRCNGFFSFVLSLVAFGAAVNYRLPVTRVYDKFIQIGTTAILWSFCLSVFLYIKSFRCNQKELAPGGNTGNMAYDFFMGRELNPRIGSLDLKFFCEMRPGLIGWVILDLVFVLKATELHGHPPMPLLLVTAFHALYVADALWFEDAILTTMDILHDGFGYMLVFGDLAWVPFLYSLQARYILEHGSIMPWYCLASIILLNFVGFYIFRSSNSQKNEFRKNPKNPSLAHLETIPTQTGNRLIVSSWWGMCHKPNYLGDIIMAISWSLTCGISHVIPYFYPVYFTILLIDREKRDHHICHKKYRSSWDKYCKRVKYRIFPYVY